MINNNDFTLIRQMVELHFKYQKEDIKKNPKNFEYDFDIIQGTYGWEEAGEKKDTTLCFKTIFVDSHETIFLKQAHVNANDLPTIQYIAKCYLLDNIVNYIKKYPKFRVSPNLTKQAMLKLQELWRQLPFSVRNPKKPKLLELIVRAVERKRQIELARSSMLKFTIYAFFMLIIFPLMIFLICSLKNNRDWLEEHGLTIDYFNYYAIAVGGSAMMFLHQCINLNPPRLYTKKEILFPIPKPMAMPTISDEFKSFIGSVPIDKIQIPKAPPKTSTSSSSSQVTTPLENPDGKHENESDYKQKMQ